MAQARGRPGRDRRLTLPKSSEHRVVACAPLMMMMYLSQEKTALPQIAEKKEAVTLSPKKLGCEGRRGSSQGQVIGMQEAEKVQLHTLEEKRRLNEGDYLAKLHDNSLLSNLLEAFAVLERRFNLWDRDEAGMLLFTAVPLP